MLRTVLLLVGSLTLLSGSALARAGAEGSGAARALATPTTVATVGPVGTVMPVGAIAPVGAGVDYAAPVPSPWRVVRGFVAPSSRYGAGHRGVDLATAPGQPVRAAAAGAVTYAGVLAGRGVVVLLHADGVRTEYEPVRPLVQRGAQVRQGEVIATVQGVHRDCPPGRCLHWGARRGEAYLDPLTLLVPLGPVRLLPLTGSPQPVPRS